MNRFEIDNKTIIRFWLVPVAIIATAALLYWARHGLVLIASAVFVAIAINPLINVLARRLKIKRGLSSILSFLIIILSLTVLGFLIVPSIVDQTVNFAKILPDELTARIENFANSDGIFANQDVKSITEEIVKSIDDNKEKWAGNVGSKLFSGVNSVMSFMSASFVVFFLALLMAIDAPKLKREFWGLYPEGTTKKTHQKVVGRIIKVVNGFVGGQLTIALISGSATSVAVFVISLIFKEIPSGLSAPIGLIVGLFGLIPVIGATIGAVIGALMMIFYSPLAGAIFLVYCVIYQQVENSVIVPAIQSKTIELSPLVVLIAVTIGLYVSGIAGGLIAIPIAGSLKVIIEELVINSRFIPKKNRS